MRSSDIILFLFPLWIVVNETTGFSLILHNSRLDDRRL